MEGKRITGGTGRWRADEVEGKGTGRIGLALAASWGQEGSGEMAMGRWWLFICNNSTRKPFLEQIFICISDFMVLDLESTPFP